MVQFDEARQLMDEMMKVTIFQPSEKRRMLEDNRKAFLDPNLIMDTRHKIFREELCKFPAKSLVLAEARKLLTQEEAKELRLKKEQAFIEKELRKFEQDLQKSRPKFCGLYTCSRKSLANSNDEDFWRTTGKVKVLVNKRRGKITEQKKHIQKKSKQKVSIVEPKDTARHSINELEGVPFGNIKVTIKDKPSGESEEHRLCVTRLCFEALRENARDKRRLREIKTNIQIIVSQKRLRRCVRVWRTYVENAKKQREERAQDLNTRKIETLIDVIADTQKKLTKYRGAAELKSLPSNWSKGTEAKKNTPVRRPFVVESPAQNRLNAQKEIIRKQRQKLAEQNKLIEELKLQQVHEEITRSSEQTVNVAKETLTYCGQQTRRTLIQLMRQAGYRDKSLTAPVRVPSPPQFLARMEARAEARRNRVRLREETRQKREEEKRRREENARKEEERERKRSQQEALREARRIREEREEQRVREIERYKKLEAMAASFYRKHLLRRYIMQPFVALVELKKDYINKANSHYERRLLRNVIAGWKIETERQMQIKVELATSLYERNLSLCALQKLRESVKEEKKKEQVAKDFSDMKLQNRCFKQWKVKALEYKAERLKSERLATEYHEKKLKVKYLSMWKRYPTIAPDIAESERVKDTWRKMVQEVVLDFDPRQRGVIIEN